MRKVTELIWARLVILIILLILLANYGFSQVQVHPFNSIEGYPRLSATFDNGNTELIFGSRWIHNPTPVTDYSKQYITINTTYTGIGQSIELKWIENIYTIFRFELLYRWGLKYQERDGCSFCYITIRDNSFDVRTSAAIRLELSLNQDVKLFTETGIQYFMLLKKNSSFPVFIEAGTVFEW